MTAVLLRIGTRASPMAVAQTGRVAQELAAANPELAAPGAIELVKITTMGDQMQDRKLSEIGGKALFTKEIEDALLKGEIDVAVHSLKDVPADDVPGLVLCAFPEREDPRDAFVSATYRTIDDLPHGARLGTASLRRQAQALSHRPDLDIVLVRGNVDTRLRKLDEGQVDALVLAAAGLNRLGLSGRINSHIDSNLYACAPGQGALALQCRAGDAGQDWMKAVHHEATGLCIAAERGALVALEASCRTAVGAYATLTDGELHLFVEALSGDGRARWQRRASLKAPTVDGARRLGLKLGEDIKAEAGPNLITA